MSSEICVTDFSLSCSVARAGEESILRIWWDPEQECVEEAALRSGESEEPVPLELLWLLVDYDDLLDALYDADVADRACCEEEE